MSDMGRILLFFILPFLVTFNFFIFVKTVLMALGWPFVFSPVIVPFERAPYFYSCHPSSPHHGQELRTQNSPGLG